MSQINENENTDIPSFDPIEPQVIYDHVLKLTKNSKGRDLLIEAADTINHLNHQLAEIAVLVGLDRDVDPSEISTQIYALFGGYTPVNTVEADHHVGRDDPIEHTETVETVHDVVNSIFVENKGYENQAQGVDFTPTMKYASPLPSDLQRISLFGSALIGLSEQYTNLPQWISSGARELIQFAES